MKKITLIICLFITLLIFGIHLDDDIIGEWVSVSKNSDGEISYSIYFDFLENGKFIIYLYDSGETITSAGKWEVYKKDEKKFLITYFEKDKQEWEYYFDEDGLLHLIAEEVFIVLNKVQNNED